MNDEYDEGESRQYMKSYMFIKGFVVGRELKQTMIALSFVRQPHDGQYRKDETPYIFHPLKVCSTLISYGVENPSVESVYVDTQFSYNLCSGDS